MRSLADVSAALRQSSQRRKRTSATFCPKITATSDASARTASTCAFSGHQGGSMRLPLHLVLSRKTSQPPRNTLGPRQNTPRTRSISTTAKTLSRPSFLLTAFSMTKTRHLPHQLSRASHSGAIARSSIAETCNLCRLSLPRPSETQVNRSTSSLQSNSSRSLSHATAQTRISSRLHSPRARRSPMAALKSAERAVTRLSQLRMRKS